MSRNMSFALTTKQVRERTKTVTRRMGWESLRPGYAMQAVVKCQGLKKGEKVEPIAPIETVDVRREPLRRLTDDLDYGFAETTKEGFPEGHPLHWPSEFVAFFCKSHKGCTPDSIITRIEFKYADDALRAA